MLVENCVNRQTRSRLWIASIFVLLILLIDQFIKWEVKTGMSLYERIEVTSWFHILFTENQGMAFGMQFIGTLFLTIFRVVAIVFFLVYLFRLCRKQAPWGLIVCVAAIIAGAIGNVIDNCLYGLIFSESQYNEIAQFVTFGEGYGHFMEGKVVDMFYFPLFTWPDWVPLLGGEVFFSAIFNFADASISCGIVAMLLFYPKYIGLTKESNQAAESSDKSEDTDMVSSK